KMQVQADLCILRLICAGGMVPHLLRNPAWRDLFSTLNPDYKVTSETEFVDTLIPAEAAEVRRLQIEKLRAVDWLLWTFDGSTVRKKDGFYTVHATDPDGESYLIEMLRGDHTEAHTAKWITDKVTPLIEEIGLHNAGGVCSDNTNVTKLARSIIREKISTIIALWDCVHFIHGMIGDITNLPQFVKVRLNLLCAATMVSGRKQVTKIVKATVAHFGKSNKSTHLIHRARTDKGEVANELQKPGTTRFGSMWSTFVSILPYIEIIQTLVRDGKIKFKVCSMFASCSSQGSIDFLRFKTAIEIYINIVGPMIRSLWSLEAARARGSDVFIFWHAIAATLKHLLEQPTSTTGISLTLARRITTIFNRRFKKFFENEFYFVTFCMDPRYPHDSFLKPDPVPPVASISTSSTSARPPVRSATEIYRSAFNHVADYLQEILKELLERLEKDPEHAHPVFVGQDPAVVAEEWYSQLCAFWTGQYPFDLAIRDGDARKWWQTLVGHPLARFLAVTVLKLFSLTVNSMADERTNSMVTWMNSPLRGRQSVQTIQDMVQVGQFHRSQARAEAATKASYHPVVKFRKLDAGKICDVQALERAPADVEDDSGSEDEAEEEEVGLSNDEQVAEPEPMEDDPSSDEDEDEEQTRSVNFVVDRHMDISSSGLLDMLASEKPAPDTSGDKGKKSAAPKGPVTKVSAIDWAAIRKGASM
ncbi:ribonuclease H-like domain-containing protein, partial [Mycena pura]